MISSRLLLKESPLCILHHFPLASVGEDGGTCGLCVPCSLEGSARRAEATRAPSTQARLLCPAALAPASPMVVGEIPSTHTLVFT